MNTRKPISTISYNSFDFLYDRLNSLVSCQYLQFFAFIKHSAEAEEKKDHFHLYVEPNNTINTVDLANQFIEFVPDSLPLKCITFKPSKWDDWLLYSLHDTNYLASKFLEKKYHYRIEEVISSDSDECYQRYVDTLHESDNLVAVRFHDMLKSNITVGKLCFNGNINPRDVHNFLQFQNQYYEYLNHKRCCDDAESCFIDPMEFEFYD